MKENCEEFALNLCTWSLKHPALKNDLKIKEHQIVIMYKQSMFEKMQEVVSPNNESNLWPVIQRIVSLYKIV